MGSSVSQQGLFSLLPEPKKPWSEVALSFGVQAAAVALLVWVPVLHPEIMESPVRDYHAIELVPTPVPVNHQPQPIRRFIPPPQQVAQLDPPTEALRLPAALPKPKIKLDDPAAPEVVMAAKKLENVPPLPKPVIPRAPVKMNVFSSGSSATPTVALAAEKVQTGGFGDPHGVPAKASVGKPITIAQLGSFDMPTGPGSGNGTGGANGARGVVVSSGFGNGVAVSDSRPSQRGVVQQAGFGNADVPAPPTSGSRTAQTIAPKIVPAEILWKPVPIYTEDALKQKVEGEVLVEAVLEASGKVKVLRVVRGLGHGLDEEAVKEAGQLRFKPALRDGQPSDSTVVLHVIFQIA
ncbi:MAG: energy transducer TonB [Candidatus Sulfotelmatobacter sp.]